MAGAPAGRILRPCPGAAGTEPETLPAGTKRRTTMRATRITRQATGWIATATISLMLALSGTAATASPGPGPGFEDLDGSGRVDPPANTTAPASGASHGPTSYLVGEIGFTS